MTSLYHYTKQDSEPQGEKMFSNTKGTWGCMGIVLWVNSNHTKRWLPSILLKVKLNVLIFEDILIQNKIQFMTATRDSIKQN